MKKKLLLSAIIIGLFLTASSAFSQTTGLFTMNYPENGVNYPISFYVPEDYSANNSYPMIFGWHGSGMPGTFMAQWLNQTIAQKEKIILVCPDIAGVTSGTTFTAIINAALQYATTTYNVDPAKWVISGFSMGGSYAFQIGLGNPTLFRGIIGVSPAIGSAAFTQPMWDNIKSIRMATIEGDKDFNWDVVNTLMTDIKSKGANLLYIVKPNVEHADQTYLVSQEYYNDYKKCWDYIFGITDVKENFIENFQINLFPNPISTTANISYTIENPANVSISIQNALGEEVAKGIDNKFVAAGSYTDIINTSSLLPGVYFCNIKTDNSTETKKFIVIK